MIARGAEIDPVESNWSNTPLGAAVYSQHQEMIDLLSRYSHDIWELTYAGKIERLRDVLAEDPDASARDRAGDTRRSCGSSRTTSRARWPSRSS